MVLDDIAFNTLTREEADSMEECFSLEEVEDKVKDSGGDKCLGPDGYNFNFPRTC